jgi:thiamine-phosphate diphosphorylase
VGAAVSAGVDWVQIRERTLEGAALLELCDRIGAAARAAARRAGRAVRLVVNRRADVALASAADGLHLGWDAMDPVSARALLGPQVAIGMSLHGPDEVGSADGCDYVQLAPIFAPLSKSAPSRAPLGLAGVRAAAGRGVPVLAQGGVDAGNAGALCDAGAAGVAVTGAILMAGDPQAAAAALRRALDAGRP